MKNFILILAVALFLLSACAPKVDLEAEKANVKSTIDQYTKVLETEDIELLSKLTAHEADIISFGTAAGERIVGWEALKELMQTQFETTETTKFSVKDLVIKVHDSGKVAWFSETIDWNIIAAEQEIMMEGLRVTGVLENIDGNWLFVQVHYSIPTVE
jgi:uncharacterized surface anchored protein